MQDLLPLDPIGQVKQYKYGLDNQIATVSYANSVNPTPSVSFTYDPYFRRVTSMTDGSGRTLYHYQPVGLLGALRLQQEAGAHQIDNVVYQYDALGRVSTRTVDVTSEMFVYDALGRVTSHTSPLGAFAYGYLGQTAQVTSRQTQGGAVSTTWTYDTNINDRRLLDIANSGATRSYRYTTTPENQITQIAESAATGSPVAPQTWNYTYDNADRLLTGSASGGSQYSYGFDPAGNITSSTGPSTNNMAAYNGLNQIGTFAGQPFAYDADGNLTDDGTRTYTWDAENRLVSITLKAQPGRTTSIVYDGIGRRVAINTATGNASTTTEYLWCGQSLCQARTGASRVSRHYYPEGEAIAGGAALIYAQDQLGSVRDVLDGTTSNRVVSFDYDPYGNPVQSVGQASTDFRYAGLFYEQNTGLYLAGHRTYDAKAGRWLSRDPIAENGGVNVYEYVGSGPVISRDPSGLDYVACSDNQLALSSTTINTNQLTPEDAAESFSWPQQFSAQGNELIDAGNYLLGFTPLGRPLGYFSIASDLIKGNVGTALLDLAGTVSYLGQIVSAGQFANNTYNNYNDVGSTMTDGTPYLTGADVNSMSTMTLGMMGASAAGSKPVGQPGIAPSQFAVAISDFTASGFSGRHR